jgi:glutaredoxin
VCAKAKKTLFTRKRKGGQKKWNPQQQTHIKKKETQEERNEKEKRVHSVRHNVERERRTEGKREEEQHSERFSFNRFPFIPF